MSPFKDLYGRDPLLLLKGEGGATIEEIWGLMYKRNSMLDKLKMQLDQAQQRMKMYADKKRREVEFQLGDRVF